MAAFEVLAFGVAILLVVYWLKLTWSELKGIPEPPCNFLLGHAASLGGNVSKTFLEWKRAVGPVFQIRVLHFRALVLNDKDSITKCCLMSEGSGRCKFGLMLMLPELYGYGVISAEGSYLQEQRQFYLKSFRTMGIGREATEVCILSEIDQVVQDWMETGGKPFELHSCTSNYVAKTMWNVLGNKSLSNHEANNMVRYLHRVGDMETVKAKLDLLFPEYMQKISKSARDKIEMFGSVIVDPCSRLVKEHLKDRVPNQPRDVIDMMLDRMEAAESSASPFHRNNLDKGLLLAEVISASMDTTTNSLEFLLLYLSKYPEVRARIQQDIQSVVGPSETVVQLRHRDQMPYVQACIHELLRITSVAPIAIPHRALEDFQFQGAKVPKGTVILMNLYAVHHDPEVWDEPAVFKPERFLTSEGEVDIGVVNKTLPFGVGRRSCIEILNCPEVVEERFGIVCGPPAGLQVTAVPRV